MIRIERFVCNMIRENCYVVADDTQECVIVDCGAFYNEERRAIVDYIRQERLTPTHLIATHGHIDHNFGNNTIYNNFGLTVEVSAGDGALMRHLKEQAIEICGVRVTYDFPAVGRFFGADDIITFGNHRIHVIETPGHSKGSVCFYCPEEKVLFTGDTLFRASIGRADLPGGSMFQIIQSLRKLAQLPDDVVVLPGHGEQTTIGREVVSNPYMER